MASFPSINPSYNMQKRSRPSVRSVQFGDGYTQRIIWGENQNPKVWNLDWRNISEADSDTIETFLDARGGKESFDWTPPGSSTGSKWICLSWSKSIPYLNRATIRATFVEVFEP